MAKKPETTEIAVVPDDIFDLMTPSDDRLELEGSEAGLGTEDIDSSDVRIARVSLLQAMSKACVDEKPGAAPGRMWMSMLDRPATLASDPNKAEARLMFVPVRVMKAQRRWKALEEGGGIECEAPSKYKARNEEGLADAKLEIVTVDGNARVTWVGGTPTDNCLKCAFGPGASALSVGQKVAGAGATGWLPKKLKTLTGEVITLPDKIRAPRCTASIDVLCLVRIPAHENFDAEIVPAMISFARTSYPAGRALAGMMKQAGTREPAWARIYQLKPKKVQNPSGTFYIFTVEMLGSTRPELAAIASELFYASQETEHRAVYDEPDGGFVDATSTSAPPSDNEVAPDGEF
jgi:hypothetical protein